MSNDGPVMAMSWSEQVDAFIKTDWQQVLG